MSERELTSSEALFNIMSTIHTLGFEAVARYAGPSKLVATAELFDKNNNLVESGAGKGPDSLIGALAESIEHFSIFNTHANDVSKHRCDSIAAQKAAERDGIFTSLPGAEESIECFKLTTLCKKESLLVPCVLLCPITEKNKYSDQSLAMQFLARYSSNSGTAFGCTEAEALLHGTHEIIERHILSLFFMSVCGIGPKMKLYAPSKALLTKALQNNSYALENADELQIVIIKDVLSVYFSVAFPKNGAGGSHLSPIGSGSSLDICTAIQRAVTEQLQSSELYDAAEESMDRKTFELLSCSNKLKNLIDLSPIKKITLPVLDDPLQTLTETVSAQLDTLQKNLLQSGLKLFRRTILHHSNNSIVTQTYIPGLERFNIIRNGRLVAPQHVLRAKQ
ncbi:YcaO-like family protein [Pseudomonas sp. LB3P81]